MQIQEYLNILTAIIIAPLLWVIKSLLADVRTLNKELSEHKKYCSDNYVRRDSVNREFDEIKSLLIAWIKEISSK